MNLISQYKDLRKENYVLCFGRFVTAMTMIILNPHLMIYFVPLPFSLAAITPLFLIAFQVCCLICHWTYGAIFLLVSASSYLKICKSLFSSSVKLTFVSNIGSTIFIAFSDTSNSGFIKLSAYSCLIRVIPVPNLSTNPSL